MQTTLTWLPGGAQEHFPEFCDGQLLLVAVWCCKADDRSKEWWEFEVVSVSCDSETPVSFNDVHGDGCQWDWRDVFWYADMSELRLPEGEGKQ